ncbi:MAG: PD-(D/E)XK nuclease family protein [Bacillota bacterium]|nr:PD-(D/E)XK nuclease family protein [Bacillota bacterium]
MQITEILRAKFSEYMPEETVFLCENRMLGRRILAECAKEGLLIGVHAESPLSLALDVCSTVLEQEGGAKYIEKNEAAELLLEVLKQQNKIGFFGSPYAKTMAAAEIIHGVLQEMEMAEANDFAGNEKQQELQELREAVQTVKKERNDLERSDLFHKAIELMDAGQCRKKAAHFVTLGAFSFTPLEQRFLRMYTEDRLEVLSVGIPAGAEKPKDSMEPNNDRVEIEQSLKDSRFFACRGMSTEVRSVFRDIAAEGRPFEETAIVYLSAEYAPLLQETAGRYGIPVTLSNGVSAKGSRLYYMLQCIQALPEGDFNAEEISRMLENGTLTIKSGAYGLAYRLRKAKIGWGDRERYRMVTAFAADDPEKPEDEILQEWDSFFDLLFAVVQPGESASLEEQKKTMLSFLEAFSNRSISGEAEAYGKAMAAVQRVLKLQQGETLLQRVICRMERETYMAGNAEAGSVFCMPLLQALCTGRKYIYVIGNERYSIQGGKESPILLDAERKKAFSSMKTVTDREKEMLYRYLLMIKEQASAQFTFTYPDFDSDRNIEILPSPLYRRLHETAGMPDIKRITYLTEDALSAGDQYIAEECVLKQDRKMADAADALPMLAEKMPLKEKLKDFVFSPSSLETALKCPFQFYMQKMLGLYVDEPSRRREDRWLERNTMGSFCHEVLENFYAQDPKNTDLNTAAGKEKLERLFKESLEKVIRENPPTRKELMDADQAWAKQMIEDAITWTQRENRTVLATEKRFGTSDDTVEQEGLKLSVNGREFRLQGSIDRVDRLPGKNGEAGEIVVLDYKTGDVNKMEKDRELHLQDYLYPLALKSLEEGKYEAAKAGYLMLEAGAKYLSGNETPDRSEKLIHGLLEWLDEEERALEAAPGFRFAADGKTLELAEEAERAKIFAGCSRYCRLTSICPMSGKEGE